jgi:hypothetical protein
MKLSVTLSLYMSFPHRTGNDAEAFSSHIISIAMMDVAKVHHHHCGENYAKF